MQTASNRTTTNHGTPLRDRAAPIAPVRVGVRLCLVGVVVLVVARLLTASWASAWTQVAQEGPASAGELLALGTASLAVAVAAWLVGGTALELVALLPGRVGRATAPWSRRVTPAVARRLAGFVLGVGVGVGVAGGPAQALATGSSVPVTADASPSSAGHAPDPGFRAATAMPVATSTPALTTTPTLTPAPAPVAAAAAAGRADPALASAAGPPGPGFTPTPPRVRPQADPGLLGARVTPATVDEVVVRRGDSLWSIASRHLGPDASAAEVDRSWRQWFSANRDRIGTDPDRILPGQVLRVPGPDPAAGDVR